jgi:hypothetical protein
MKKEKNEKERRKKHKKTITKKKKCSSKTYTNAIIFLRMPKPNLQFSHIYKIAENRNRRDLGRPLKVETKVENAHLFEPMIKSSILEGERDPTTRITSVTEICTLIN